GGGFVSGRGAREIAGRRCPDERGMGGANVQIRVVEELLLVLSPEDVATAAVDHSGDIDGHLPTGRRRRACSSFLSALALGGVRVRELEVRSHLLEVPYELCACCPLEHRQECAQGFDR